MQLTAKSLRAKVDYTVTDEVEVLKLAELNDTKQIAFSKSPPPFRPCPLGETVCCPCEADHCVCSQAT